MVSIIQKQNAHGGIDFFLCKNNKKIEKLEVTEELSDQICLLDDRYLYARVEKAYIPAYFNVNIELWQDQRLQCATINAGRYENGVYYVQEQTDMGCNSSRTHYFKFKDGKFSEVGEIERFPNRLPENMKIVRKQEENSSRFYLYEDKWAVQELRVTKNTPHNTCLLEGKYLYALSEDAVIPTDFDVNMELYVEPSNAGVGLREVHILKERGKYIVEEGPEQPWVSAKLHYFKFRDGRFEEVIATQNRHSKPKTASGREHT